ncbi:hypothetical protein JZ751_022570 [Albula glossodonta]|uniref:Uncharacterized protein n=1 Tax=Albula glossodonta TaxID=121402 RepID=A0A8T2PDA8_9TELE|nr:hypothetical protein JZ751_022570 [Albula glossodonta]
MFDVDIAEFSQIRIAGPRQPPAPDICSCDRGALIQRLRHLPHPPQGNPALKYGEGEGFLSPPSNPPQTLSKYGSLQNLLMLYSSVEQDGKAERKSAHNCWQEPGERTLLQAPGELSV